MIGSTSAHFCDDISADEEAAGVRMGLGGSRFAIAWSVMVLLVATGCGSAEAEDGTGEESVAPAGRVINVETTAIEVEDFTEMIRLTGTVLASHDVTMAAEESGVIRELLAERGAALTEG